MHGRRCGRAFSASASASSRSHPPLHILAARNVSSSVVAMPEQPAWGRSPDVAGSLSQRPQLQAPTSEAMCQTPKRWPRRPPVTGRPRIESARAACPTRSWPTCGRCARPTCIPSTAATAHVSTGDASTDTAGRAGWLAYCLCFGWAGSLLRWLWPFCVHLKRRLWFSALRFHHGAAGAMSSSARWPLQSWLGGLLYVLVLCRHRTLSAYTSAQAWPETSAQAS